jgi:hypothetical protein
LVNAIVNGALQMEKTGKILEKDLYWPVHNYFKKLGYDVHGEVKDCDITASKGDELIITLHI